MNDDTPPLTSHQAALNLQVDEILGEAIRLYVRLKRAHSAPLPEAETDALLRAISAFRSAAEAVRDPGISCLTEIGITTADPAERVEQLARACEEERRRGLAGDWTYSLPRHRKMFRILDDERKLNDT